jgi:hypothetical protein
MASADVQYNFFIRPFPSIKTDTQIHYNYKGNLL